MNTRLIKNASEFARTLLAIFVCFILSSPSLIVSKTASGIHCPTANIQQVRGMYGTLRAPQIGEPEFKQCQCAEKKLVEQKAELERISTSSLIPPITLAQNKLTISCPVPIQVTSIQIPLVQALLIFNRPPPTLPPK